jgi:hypothetical protein
VDYELTERSRDLAPVLGELARWGYEWAWSPPRASEAIDVGAIFRLIPGLVEHDHDGSAHGTVELAVVDGRDGEPACYSVTIGPGRAAIAEGPADSADAHVSGTLVAWIQALAPSLERVGLTITGDVSLATQLLDAVALGNGHELPDLNAESAAG